LNRTATGDQAQDNKKGIGVPGRQVGSGSHRNEEIGNHSTVTRKPELRKNQPDQDGVVLFGFEEKRVSPAER